MNATYPAREKFFAHKFVRLLHKAAVASEIGRDAFSLLTVIVHTEDAMRYRGAAKFWNSQLVETLGFKKWDQFDACRKRAIEAGWLIYVCHGKRMAGEYWVNVPDGYEMVTDAPLESYPENGYDVGYKAGYDVGYEQGMKAGTIEGRSGVRTGDEQGEPSIPIPYPIPYPKPLYKKGDQIFVPESLNEPAKIEAIGRWVLYTRDEVNGNGKPIWENSPQESELFSQVARWGLTAEQISDWVSRAISGSWKNLNNPKPGEYAKGSAHFEDDWDEVKAIVLEKYHPDVRCTKRIEQILTPEQFKAVIEVSPRKIWDSDRFDKVVPAAYRRARKGQ